MRWNPIPFGRRQRGAASLVVALLLLVGMTLVAFFANKSLIFEQRTSANQYRYTRSFEMAEAGLEWVVARLNDDLKLAAGPSCSAGTGDRFAERYLPIAGGGFTIDSTMRPGCSVGANGALTCGCPAAGDAVLGAAAEPRFTIQFNPVGGDPWAVEILAFGCTNASADGSACTEAAGSDSVSVVRALYKVKPNFPNAPSAGLITGSAAVTGGNLNVINLDVASNGVTINSGTSVELGIGTNVTTLAGTPPRASVLDNDPTLNALTTADSTGDIFFTTFFGETMAQYQSNPKTWVIKSTSCAGAARCTQCSTATSCGEAIVNAYDAGISRFWSDANIQFSTSKLPAVGTLGSNTSENPPIMVVSTKALELKGNMTAYGMFYSATGTANVDWDYAGSGTAKVFGAFVSRGNFDKGGSGTLDLIYDGNLFKPDQTRGVMIRVPGSWRDKSGEF